MKFRPLHDRVVVRRVDAEEKTVGGIIIPDTAKEKPQQGQVLAVGPITLSMLGRAKTVSSTRTTPPSSTALAPRPTLRDASSSSSN